MKSEIIEKMSWEDYKSHPALNHSKLKNLFPPNTPADFFYKEQNPKKSSIAQDFGTAIHIAIFEPNEWSDRVIIEPSIDRRTQAGKEKYASFIASSEGKIILTEEQFLSCKMISDNVKKHHILSKLIHRKHCSYETSGFFTYKDVKLKFRTDCILNDKNIILDVKTTRDPTERGFVRSVIDYNYDSQAAFYLAGMREITGKLFRNFIWIAIENIQPHKIYLYEPSDAFIMRGMRLIDDAIELYKDCVASGSFPGPKAEIITLDTPKWLEI